YRRAVATRTSDRVARHGAGDSLRIVAPERGVEADRAPIVVAGEEAGGEESRAAKYADLPVCAERREPRTAVVAQVVVEESAGCVGHGDAILHHERRTRAAMQLRRKVDRERELRRIQLVLESDSLHAEPARTGKTLQAELLGCDAPLPELRLADVERAGGGEEAHWNYFALLAVDDRLNQQRCYRGCALDAGLAFRRLGMRG